MEWQGSSERSNGSPLPREERGITGASDTPREDEDSLRRLSPLWLLLPTGIGAGLTGLAAVGNYVWNWDGFVTGTLVNFASSTALVAVFFLLERRFERREEAYRRSISLFRRDRGERAAVQVALNSVFLGVHEALSIPIRDLECTVFHVEGRIGGGGDLVRYARSAFRYDQPTGIRWTKGKGIIGRCWQQRSEVYADFRPLKNKPEQTTPEEYDELPADVKMGLPLWEWQIEIDRYDEKLALPILDSDGRFWGCIEVAVGGQMGYREARAKSRLNTETGRQVAAMGAMVIANVVER